MTVLFILLLAMLGFAMKLTALLVVRPSRSARWRFVLSAVVAPNSMRRLRARSEAPTVLFRGFSFAGLFAMNHWIYWMLTDEFELRGIVLSYLAVPSLLILAESLFPFVALLWLPAGYLLPRINNNPLAARGLAEFWGRRWNLWFSDWFRYTIFDQLRARPWLAVMLAFTVSGLMHEWVINLPLFLVTGKNLLGSMMIYFLLQGIGVLIEHHFLKGKSGLKVLCAWLFVLGPVPLLINEGLLRVLLLCPEST